MRRFLAILLSFLMIACTTTVSLNVIAASNSSDTKISGNYEYVVLSDGTVKIEKYKGTFETKITVPSKIGGKAVTEIGDFAFSMHSELVNVTIPSGVTKIGKWAFEYCSALTAITIPSGMKSIGQNAFSGCGMLKSISLPSSITSIGEDVVGGTAYYENSSNWKNGALYLGKWLISCNSQSLNSAYTVKSDTVGIADDAFKYCDVTSVKIPASVKYIGSSVFYVCYNLKSVTVASENTKYSSVNGVLFDKNKTRIIKYPSNKTNTSYTIPDTVKTVSEFAFESCNNLTKITFPQSITKIEAYAFYGCEKLKEVNIPNSVKTIGIRAFQFCSGLTKVTLPSGIKTIGSGTFYSCGNIENITIPKSVTKIGSEAFSCCNKLSKITIPDSVTSIGSQAFMNCESLASAVLPSGLTTIAAGLFSSCSNLSQVNIPDTVKTIGDSAFESTALKSISIPDSVTDIGDHTFELSALTSVKLPSGITRIGFRTFNGTYLNSINIPKKVKSIETGAFSGTLIKKLNIPSSVTSIYAEAFAGCCQLEELVIPDTVKSLGSSAFKRCIGLKTVKISKNIKTVPDFSFLECNSLESVTIPEGITKIGHNAFANCPKIESIQLPSTVKSIDDTAFYACTKLSSVSLPDGLESIGDLAFCGTNITSVKCPNGLKSVGYNPFDITPFSDDQKKGGIYWGEWLIGYEDFPDGTDNEKITINKNTIGIADHVFAPVASGHNGYYLKAITIPNGVKYIGYRAFAGSEFTTLTIPDSVVDIGEGAFDRCKNLKTVKLSKNIKDIKYTTFARCSSLNSITIPTGVQRIESLAFFESALLENQNGNVKYADNWIVSVNNVPSKFTIRDGIIGICENAFLRSPNEVTIPKSVKYIPDRTFGYYSSGNSYFKMQDFVINCEDGSAALEYAKANGLNYKLIAACTHSRISGWIVDKKATASSAGSRHKECLDCNKILKTEKIAQLLCSTPSLFKAINIEGGVTVSWAKTAGADSYAVYRKTSSTQWSLIANTAKTSYTDKSTKSGTYYTYTVRAINEVGRSGYNKTGVSVKYLSTPDFRLSNGLSRITVRWNKVTGATGYIVYRKAGTEKDWVRLSKLENGETSYTDKTVKSGTYYTYTVKAYNKNTNSAYKTDVKLKHLSVPKLATAVSSSSGITVKWGKTAGSSGYIVYRKTGNGDWQKLATVKGINKLSYLDKTAKKGKTYKYTVKAYSGKTYSYYNKTGISVKCKY